MRALFSSAALALLTAAACTDNGTPGGDGGKGGSSGTGTGGSAGAPGGTSSGGTGVTGGAAGTATGGVSGSAGTATGGSPTGGASGSAGAATGGAGATGGSGAGASGAGTGGGGGAGGGTGGGGSGGLYTCPSGVTGMPLPANPVVTRVAGVPSTFGSSSSSNVEGPVWIDGSLYVSHIQEGGMSPPPARILKITGTMQEEFVMSGTNGLAVNAMGNIVGARHSTGDIATLNLGTKTFTPVAGQYMSARFNSPNDLALRRDGNIYFSDPDFQAPSSRPQNQTRVYRINPMGAVSVVDATLANPNGVTLSLDENTLYVATSGNLYRYQVMPDGSTGSPMMMNGVPGSDGMVVDCAGNLYLTDGNGHRVVVVSSSGSMVGTISMGIPDQANPTNVAFGGADHRRLYITTRGSGMNGAGLYYVDLNLPGMPY